MTASPAIARELERLLKAECAIYREYSELMTKERQAVISFKMAEVEAITARRVSLSTAMGEAHHQRLTLLKQLPEGDCEKLTTVIARQFSGADQKRLMSLAEELRSAIRASQANGLQFGQIVTYALNLVNGSISLLWSATQNVFKAYGKKGQIKESYHPSDRSQGVIKRA